MNEQSTAEKFLEYRNGQKYKDLKAESKYKKSLHKWKGRKHSMA